MELREETIQCMNDPEMFVPEHIRGGLIRYLELGIPPGGFLTAVLENNLFEAFGRADQTNQRALFGIVSWIYNNAPHDSHGSPEQVKAYAGLRQKEQEKLNNLA